jgi:hypothetical protein
MRAPSTNRITLPFGAYGEAGYTQANPHKGTDFGYLPDNKIYAPFSGKVRLIANNGSDGNGIYMTDSQGRFHGMLHSAQYLIPNGLEVVEGQPLAIMGDTGLAQGVHCHWAVKENGQFIDPMSLINGGNEDMITEDQIAIIRIIMSEVEGWNGNDIHSGKDDEIIKGAWVGHEWPEMIWHCWIAQGAHRQLLVDQIAAMSAQLKTNADTISDLKKQISAAGGTYTEADRAQATETNNLIKQIWQKLTAIFK